MTLDSLVLDRQDVGADGSRKYVWRVDGGSQVESVSWIERDSFEVWPVGGDVPVLEEGPQSIACVSSQAGCNVGCKFCATGLQPSRRNLTASEIVQQVQQAITDRPEFSRFGVAFAGMGEPLLNAAAVTQALRLLQDDARIVRTSVTTVGILDGIQELVELSSPPVLWISIHAADESVRRDLIPYARKQSLAEIVAAGARYADRTGRRSGANYLLLPGINDRPGDAEKLAALLAGGHFRCRVLMWNPIEGMRFERASDASAQAFAASLNRLGLPTGVVPSAGREVVGGCGQLVTNPSRRKH